MRIAEIDAGMLNSIGLATPASRLLRRNLPVCATVGVPLWVSVGGFSAHDYAEICERWTATGRGSS